MNSLWEASKRTPFSSPFLTVAQCESKVGNDQLVANRNIAAASAGNDFIRNCFTIDYFL